MAKWGMESMVGKELELNNPRPFLLHHMPCRLALKHLPLAPHKSQQEQYRNLDKLGICAEFPFTFPPSHPASR